MITATSHHEALSRGRQVTQCLTGIFINGGCSNRHFQHNVGTFGTGAVAATALLTVFSAITTGVAVINQGVEVLIGFQKYGTAVATITAVRTTLGNEFFTTEADAAVTAFAGVDADLGFIYKLHIG